MAIAAPRRRGLRARARYGAAAAIALALAASAALLHCHGSPAATTLAAATPAVATPPAALIVEESPRFSRRAGEAPIALTASDGTGLRLTALRARAVVDEPLAFTEVRLTFENPEPRTLEGRFAITLPQGATVSRFAMKIDGAWQEAEIVEKAEARRAYEDFLHRRQDPALLEQGAGNEFTARVFPIPARGKKEIVLSYSQELTAATPYAFPLSGLPAVDELDVSATLAGDKVPAQVQHTNGSKPEDFVLAAQNRRPGPGVRSGNLVLARVQPVTSPEPEPFTSTLILVDTSASRALGFDDEIAAVRRLAEQVAESAGGSARLVVAAFDQTVEAVFDGEARAYGDEAATKLRARQALGASNLEAALAFAAAQGRSAAMKRVLLVGDGVATAGEVDGEKLARSMTALKESGIERLDAIAVGGLRDDAALHRLATGTLRRDGVVVDATRDPRVVARKLTQSTRSQVAVKVEGATWQWPERLDGVQPGDEALVYAEVPDGAPVRIAVGAAPASSPDLRQVDRPLLERAWAKAKIDALVAKGEVEGRAALQKSVVDLSTRYRVMSPYTSLLVLETDADYARFHIDRRALGDILTVDGGRVALTHRTALDADALGERDEAQARRKEAPAKGTKAAGAEMKSYKDEANDPGRADDPATGQAAPTVAAAPLRADAPPPGAPPPPPRRAPAQMGMDMDSPFAADDAKKADTAAEPSKPADLEARESAGGGGAPADGARGGHGNAAAAGAIATATAAASMAPPAARPPASPVSEEAPRAAPAARRGGPGDFADALAQTNAEMPRSAAPYTGKLKTVMDAIARGETKGALDVATRWHAEEPGDVMSLVAMGEALEASGDVPRAARSYGSIIDLFPARADLRRFAGERLERVKDGGGLDLAIDSFGKAEEERPDHPASHRLLAFALLRKGDPERAFEAALRGVKQRYPEGRFLGVDQILREDLGLIAAAWIKAAPSLRADILAKLHAAGASLESGASLRFVLNWETDANDVDFHIFDAKGGHAFYAQRELASGGELYADVTTGYGPECFTIRGPKGRRAAPYTLQAHYYSRGPMGYGMGKLEIIDHDGKGNLTFEERPFVVMVDQAFVNLGKVSR